MAETALFAQSLLIGLSIAAPVGPIATLGAARFAAIGCGECHVIRGTAHDGYEGPDLTHIASRTTLAAGIMPLSHENLTRWSRHAREIKPANFMPQYSHAPEAEIEAISTYLMGLE